MSMTVMVDTDGAAWPMVEARDGYVTIAELDLVKNEATLRYVGWERISCVTLITDTPYGTRSVIISEPTFARVAGHAERFDPTKDLIKEAVHE